MCTFCGGNSCPHENYRTHPSAAIEGLHSDWVASDILATQRLSSRLIKRFNLMTAFNRCRSCSAGITAVFNLQLPGEHPYCGDGIRESGFSYTPEELNEAGVSFYNQGWPDMKVPDLSHMINTVHLMMFALQGGGKIAVHCHAGYGRTGVAIACLMMFRDASLTPQKVIQEIRSHRAKCIQTAKQQAFVSAFYESNRHTVLQEKRALFPSYPKTMREHIEAQSVLLHGKEWKQLQNCPKIIAFLCTRIAEIADGDSLIEAILRPAENTLDARIAALKQQLNQGVWTSLNEERSLAVLVHLLLNWLDTALLDPPLYLSATVTVLQRVIETSTSFSAEAALQLSQAKFTLLQTIVEKVVGLVPAPCEGQCEAAIARVCQSLQGLHRTNSFVKQKSSPAVQLAYDWSRKAIAS